MIVVAITVPVVLLGVNLRTLLLVLSATYKLLLASTNIPSGLPKVLTPVADALATMIGELLPGAVLTIVLSELLLK